MTKDVKMPGYKEVQPKRCCQNCVYSELDYEGSLGCMHPSLKGSLYVFIVESYAICDLHQKKSEVENII